MDIRMPVLDGVAATREVTRTTDTRVLVLTTYDLDEYVFSALETGASGFLLKDSPPTTSCRGCAWWLSGSRCCPQGDQPAGP